MEEEIIREIMEECNLGKEIFVNVLINICKYYKINDVKKITKYIKNIVKT